MEGLDAISETAGAAAVEMAVAALLERGGKVEPCTNCAAPMIGAYCSVCGQPVETHRRSVFVLLHDFVKDVASFDSRILRTARALLFEPGELPLAFREGRTQRYVPPVRLYLFVTLAFFLILSAAHIAIMQLVPEAKPQKIVVENGKVYAIVPGEEKIPLPARYSDGKRHYSISVDNAIFFQREGAYHSKISAAALQDMEEKINQARRTHENARVIWLSATIRRTIESLAKDPAALNGALTAWIPRALFLLLPMFALLLAVFYWRQRRTFYFVDHLVFSLGFHTFAFAALLIAAGLAQFLAGDVVAWSILAALGLYLLLAMRRFYAQSWLWTCVKFATISSLYAVFFIAPAFIAILVMSVLYG